MVGLVGQKKVVTISNSFYVVSGALISPHAKFHPNPIENLEVENFHHCLLLVGQVGRSKNGRRHFKLILRCFRAIISSLIKFHPNRMKNAEVENFRFWLVLVGQAGRSKNGRSHLIC